jgi:hypothetical protein
LFLRRASAVVAAATLTACASAPSGPQGGCTSGCEADAGSGNDAGTGTPDGGGTSGADAGSPTDAGGVDAGGAWDAGTGDAGSWRTDINDCWTDVSCQRALLVSHGGDWDVTLTPPVPYESFTAFQRAYDGGADAVKMDLRMTLDHVAVAVHSSPLAAYESLDCAGKYIEQMTAAQVTQCHIFPSQETFQRVDTLLNWARGKVLVMLTVKLSTDLGGGIATALANQGQEFVSFETNPTDFQDTIPDAGGWDQFHYLVNIADLSDIPTMLALHDLRAFAYEMTPTYVDAGTAEVSALIANVIHPAGVKSFAATSTTLPTVQNHLDLFNEGFDIVMTYGLANGVTARVQVDEARGITPP